MPGAFMRWRAAAALTKRTHGSEGRFHKRRRCRPPRSSAAPMASARGRAAWKRPPRCPKASRSKAAIAAWAIIPPPSTRWRIVWLSPRAGGRRSTAAAGAAWSIPIPPGKTGFAGVDRFLLGPLVPGRDERNSLLEGWGGGGSPHLLPRGETPSPQAVGFALSPQEGRG